MEINNIIQKARQLSRVINNNVPSLSLDKQDSPYSYDGSFGTIYDMVRTNQIKLLTQGGQVVGISVDSCTNSVEQDNLAGYQFAKAYSSEKALRYVQAAMALVASGIEVDDITEDKEIRIYLYKQGKVLDINLNTIVELNDEEADQADLNNIRELLDAKLTPQPATTTTTTHTTDLPEELVIDEDDVIRAGSIADYLRNRYGHYLAKGNRFIYDYDPEEEVYQVTNIKWGRKI